MKKTFILILLINVQILIAQSSQVIDSKYLSSLVYLKTNKDINLKISNYFKRWLKKDVKKLPVEFNISKYIEYMPPLDYTYEKININEYLKKDSLKSHRKKYFFELEERPSFKKLIPQNDSKLYLIFSKPINNYLIAEFMIKNSKYEIDMSIQKRGPALQLLIFFDKNGLVENIFTSGYYYN